MDNTVMELINSIANSPSAYLTLFVVLLWYVLKTSQWREERMREQLDKIVPILDNLVRDVNDIKNGLKER